MPRDHGAKRPAFHSDFEKILGEPGVPSTSIVFGEKGSGKTAIRMQIADRVKRHNAQHAGQRTFVIHYDDLNRYLDTLYVREGSPKDPLAALQTIRLVDHIDAVVSIGIQKLMGSIVDDGGDDHPLPPDEARRQLKSMPPELRRDLLLLQAVYDTSDPTGERTRRLRRALRLPPNWNRRLWLAAAALGWLPAAAVLVWLMTLTGAERQGVTGIVLWIVFAVLALAYAGVAFKVFALDRVRASGLAKRVRREVRVLDRTEDAYRDAIAQLDESVANPTYLPATPVDETRYTMLSRLQRVLRHFGFTGMLVLVDRMDEPTLVNGDAERMKAIVWPMMNNKFLQQEKIGLKLLLPVELRHALFRESSSFFQEARLDKQNLIERLTWTGAMLYDLCDTRLKSCLEKDAEPIGLMTIFDESVSRTDVVDALDQMHQPRDAFKFMYRVVAEHCSNVTADQDAYRISRSTLEGVRKQEADRVQQLYRGIRPA